MENNFHQEEYKQNANNAIGFYDGINLNIETPKTITDKNKVNEIKPTIQNKKENIIPKSEPNNKTTLPLEDEEKNKKNKENDMKGFNKNVSKNMDKAVKNLDSFVELDSSPQINDNKVENSEGNVNLENIKFSSNVDVNEDSSVNSSSM